jgi:hypothetical protein
MLAGSCDAALLIGKSANCGETPVPELRLYLRNPAHPVHQARSVAPAEVLSQH